MLYFRGNRGGFLRVLPVAALAPRPQRTNPHRGEAEERQRRLTPDERGGEANGEKRRTSEPPRLLPRTASGGVPSRDADGFGQASPAGASATSGAGTQTKEQRRRTAAATPARPMEGGGALALNYGGGKTTFRKTLVLRRRLEELLAEQSGACNSSENPGFAKRGTKRSEVTSLSWLYRR